mgnify:CR=1 FL=1
MATTKELSRISLRTDQVLEIHFDRFPELPPEAAKLPGMQNWITGMKLVRERDVQAFHRLVNNVSSISSNMKVEVRTSDPSNPVTGQIWLRVDL